MSLPSWRGLTAEVRRDPDFASQVERLKRKPPGKRYRLARFILQTFLKDPATQKFLDFGWGEIIDLMADQVIRNRQLTAPGPLLSPVSGPGQTIERRFNQLPCTRLTALKRVAKAKELVPLDAQILVLGDDDHLSVELALAGFTNVTALDICETVLGRIEQISTERAIKVRLVCHDLNDVPPSSLTSVPYDLVFLDPFYSIEGVRLFLGSALRIARHRKETRFFLSLHVMSLLESGIPALAGLLKSFGLEVEEFHQGFNAYPVPREIKGLIHLVNQLLIGSKTLTTEGYAFPYFFSDAVLLRSAPS